MLLGYIISENKIELNNFKNLNYLESTDDSLPKLFVGKEFTKNLGVKISILNKKISKNSFWTYSSKEKKSEFNDDLDAFKKHCLSSLLNNIKYFYIDPYQINFTYFKKLMNKIKSVNDGIFFETDKMCYIYFDELTMGVNYDSLEYMGIKKDKVIKLLLSNNFKTLPKDEIFIECMEIVKKIDNIKVLPFLYYHKKYDK